MTKQTTVNNFIQALQERTCQHPGGIEYALGFLHGVLSDLNLQGEDEKTIIKNTAALKQLNYKHVCDSPANYMNDNWRPACGGTEVPFTSRSGKRLQYVWQPSTGHHAYLDVESDLILSDEEAEACLALH